jgi:hypothetical protein
MSAPYKRSDPKKLEADRKEIERSQQELQAPQMVKRTPGIKDYLKMGKEMIEIKILERRQRKNPPARKEGAKVIGHLPKDRRVDA